MNGLLIIDKPVGLTSHDIVSRVRRALRTKRVGHTGTLDPFATGVVVLLIGQATRLARFLDKDEKEYEATIRFGFATDSGDLTGVPTERSPSSDDEIGKIIEATEWDSILAGFQGNIEQTPPMYSAKKIAGKKLYEHARKGETVERKPIKISIHRLTITSPRPPALDYPSIPISVTCSAGTYIRTLAEDIGTAAGIPAHLTALRRIRAGRFSLYDSVSLDTVMESEDPAAYLRPMGDAVSHLSRFVVPDERIVKTRSGLPTRILSESFIAGESIRIESTAGELIGIGEYDEAENIVQPKVVLV